jgi:small subunit ribosomal protein S1
MEKKDEESFAALFESQAQKEKIRRKLPRVGEAIEATVVQVGKDVVFVELDGKRQAQLERVELGDQPIAVGDTIRAHVVAVDAQTGDVRLAKSMGKPGHLAGVQQAKESGVAVEGKVTALNKGGLEVDLGGVRAFCPISQADNKYVQDASVLVGKTLQFLVTEVKDRGVTLSRRALLEREGREAASRLMKDMKAGAVMADTITSVRDFGAFVDLGGVEGMIPASEVSHERGVKLEDTLHAGEAVTVQVREVKEAEGKIKITLSLKALLADPWEKAAELAPVGRVVEGTVTRVVDFGAFVKLAAGLEGLLHASEMGQRNLKPGQSISVVVQSVDAEKKKISLSLAASGMAVGSKVADAKVSIGAVVTGSVTRIETYGIFVQLEGTSGKAGRGLIPNAELGVPRGTDLRKTFPEGTKVTAKVLETGDGKLRLSIKAAKDAEERSHYEGFASAPSTLGTFGDLLNKAKAKKANKK